MSDTKPYKSWKKMQAVKSHTFFLVVFFSDQSPQARETKEKINKWDYIKQKRFLHSKGNHQQDGFWLILSPSFIGTPLPPPL